RLRPDPPDAMSRPTSIPSQVSTVVIPVAAVFVVLAGMSLRLAGIDPEWATRVWFVGLLAVGSPVLWRTLRHVARLHLATDVVAMLAIAGAIILGQPLAGLIVVIMQTGGEALERFAEGRASRAVRQLEADAPRIAHRLRDGRGEDIEVDAIAVGDELLIRPGDMVPCDCT